MNQASAEVTSRVEAGIAGSLLDVVQADDVIAIHDASVRKLLLVDDRLGVADEGASLPVGANVIAIDHGVVIWTSNPLAVWIFRDDDLATAVESNIAERDPDLTGQRAGMVVADTNGRVVVVDPSADTLTLLDGGGSTIVVENAGLSTNAGIDVSLLGGVPVLVDNNRVGILDADRIVWAPLSDVVPGPLSLQRPGPEARHVVAVDTEGAVNQINVVTGVVDELFVSDSRVAMRPIVDGECVHAGFASPPRYVRDCAADDNDRDVLLDNYSPNLRLRQVNGWVWMNDVSNGLALVAGRQGDIRSVGDWVSAFEADEPLSTTNGDGGGAIGAAANADERANADASGSELGSDDEFDGDNRNVDPFARDDERQTRVGRPVVISVLDNDEDPDGDVLLVSRADSQSSDTAVTVTPNGTAVQISPPPDFRGVVEARYTVTDGRGGEDTATITVTVRDADPSTNQPPVPVADIVAARPGRPSTINLLDNDTDPEGDTLVLTAVTGEGASFAFTVDGLLTVTPDSVGSDEDITLSYTVVDDFGASSEGSVLVRVLPSDSNSRPDARNDSAVVALGGRVILNVLGNDSDPDGDALVVAVRPVLIAGDLDGGDSISVSPDGELFFAPTRLGTFVWTYAASDGQASDVAQIRIDVKAIGQNRPPVAIRDDVVIPRGGSRIVRVLTNDGDPDGDVLGIVSSRVDAATGLTVEIIPDVGFRVTVGADSPSRPQFVYAVSDGLSAPVEAVVVVAVVDGVMADQPPVLQADVVDVRAGGTIQAALLLNDFDPEGGVLRIVQVSERSEATITINPDGQTVQISVPTTTRQPFTFVYNAVDDGGNQSATTVRVRVRQIDSPNRPPIARLDTVSVRSDGSVEIDVMANDTDPDGDAIRVDGIARQPANGTAELLSDTGAIVYTPNADFRGTDTLEYLLLDALGAARVGEVRIGVMPAPRSNQPPQAVDDLGYMAIAGGSSIAIPVTTNDFDPDNDLLTVLSTTAPQAGTVGLGAQVGSVVYTPPPVGLGFTETRFGYTITDGAGHTASAEVQVMIVEPPDEEAVPQPPVAVDDVVGPFPEGEEVLVSVLDNDSDPDGTVGALRVSVGAGASVVGNKVQVVVPRETREFDYTITDGDNLSDTGTITLLVTPNSSPVTTTIEVSTDFQTPIVVELGPGATDPDGDPIEFSCCESVQNGSTDVLSAGVGGARVEFEPNGGFSGVASFAYQVDDRAGHQVTGRVQITVRPAVNVAPSADDIRFEIEAGLDQPLDLSNFARDPDVDDSLTYTVVPPPQGEVVSVDGGGPIVVISAPIFADDGDDVEFSYRVTDLTGATAEATVFVHVVPTSEPAPVAVPDTASTLVGIPITIPVLQNDSGLGISILSVGAVDGGEVAIAGSGSVEFTADRGRRGQVATFTYTIVDVAGRTASATVTVGVTDVPDPPSAPGILAEGSQTCSVTWLTPANNGGAIGGYVVEVDTGRTVDVGLVNAVLFDDLIDGVTYRFRVTASNAAGSSSVSDWSLPCRPDVVPGRPAAPTVAFGNTEATVTWSPPSAAQGSSILSYDLQVLSATNAIQTIAATSGGPISHVWTGLSNGQTYQFQVRAVNAEGEGSWSEPSVTVVPCGPTATPGAPSVVRGDESFALSWNPPVPDGGCSPNRYEVERDPGGTVLSTTLTSLDVSGLDAGESYRFRVRAFNDAGPSGWSDWTTEIPFCGVPSGPAVPTFQTDRLMSTGYSSGSLDLIWGAPADNGGCPILSYSVRIAGTGTTQSTSALPSDAAPFQFTGLVNGTAYSFEVRAGNGIGPGPWSGPSNNATPFGPPVCSTGAISAANVGVGQVQVTSTITCTANGSPTGLQYRLRTNGGALTDFTSGDIITGLAQGTLHRFEVFVFNSPFVPAGIRMGGAEVTTWGAPNPVTGLVCSAGDAGGSCSWNAPLTNGSPIIGYDVELTPGPTTLGHPATSISFSGLANGTVYSVRSRACNAVGCGSWSVSASFVPVAPLTLAISRGGPADGVGGCVGLECSFIVVTLGGPWLAPFDMVCFVNDGTSAADILFTGSTSAPSNACVTNRGPEGVTVTLDGFRSNTIFW